MQAHPTATTQVHTLEDVPIARSMIERGMVSELDIWAEHGDAEFTAAVNDLVATLPEKVREGLPAPLATP